MPAQKDTQSQIARKVNFAIQLLRETAELLETSPESTFSTKGQRYRRPSAERINSAELTGTSRHRFSRVLKRESAGRPGTPHSS
jgi:hypothetical protein